MVDLHGGWHDIDVSGGRGNDTFVVDGGFVPNGSDDEDDVMYIWGGLGDDTFRQGEESAATSANGT